MNKAIELALETWYKPDSPLYRDPLHPAIKLAGEAGELLDLYGKNEWKPHFSWWQCKHCKQEIGLHALFEGEVWCGAGGYYTPLVLDELGDYWYYLRILAFIYDVEFQDWTSVHKNSISLLLVNMNSTSASLAKDAVIGGKFRSHRLNWCYTYLTNILALLDTTLDELTELNYRKLHGGDNHGWKDAR